jgi:Fe-S cluster biogenesis protein NfuA
MSASTVDPSLSLYAEATPNPEALKFVCNRMLVKRGAFEFTSAEEAVGNPLIEKLFAHPQVCNVFVTQNFFSITKTEDKRWVQLIPEIRDLIKAELSAETPILGDALLAEAEAEAPQSADELENRIREILQTHVKPAVEMDGGAIDFDSFEGGVLKVRLRGSCSGCPSSTVTLKQGIENLMQRMVPEVEAVEAIDG